MLQERYVMVKVYVRKGIGNKKNGKNKKAKAGTWQWKMSY